CGGRHVLETKLALIAVEMAGRLLSFPVAVEGRPVRQEDVHQPVAVEIENGHAVARRLEDVLLLVLAAGDVERREARLHRHVAEVYGDRRQARLDGWDPALRARRARHPLERPYRRSPRQDEGHPDGDAPGH